MRIAAIVRDEALKQALQEAAAGMSAELVYTAPAAFDGTDAPATAADVLVIELETEELERYRVMARNLGASFVAVFHTPVVMTPERIALTDEWLVLPTDASELTSRIATARQRAFGTGGPRRSKEAAELMRYEELLYDRLTGFPTLPVMIEEARDLLERRGELTVLYIHFVWYEKIEEIYGWQKLDDVLEATANALREFYAREHSQIENIMMVSHIADDDFILFTQVPSALDAAERRLQAISQQLETYLHEEIERAHGEDISALCGIYVGASTVFRNPKIRTERLIYRGIREAAQAARGAEQWERSRKVADLKSTIRDGAVFIEYHPIIVTQTEAIHGYEALARGARRELRSPEVLFEVAEEANMIWELSRLLRKRAVEGMIHELGPDQYLFLNIDPHDFDDPTFRSLDPIELGIDDPSRIVLEITERTAIKDYPRFQEYLAVFRKQGFRFAVDDAGSGYAGLGSIANLAPDYIKLDISLISNIDTNFLKQNLVETMVNFAEGQNAQVIAEGVERQEEFETIKELGVHFTQGFLFHRPKYAGLKPEPTARFSHAARATENESAGNGKES